MLTVLLWIAFLLSRGVDLFSTSGAMLLLVTAALLARFLGPVQGSSSR